MGFVGSNVFERSKNGRGKLTAPPLVQELSLSQTGSLTKRLTTMIFHIKFKIKGK
jgi:hypothetical protein